MNPTLFRLIVLAAIALPLFGAVADFLFPTLLSPGLSQAVEAEPVPKAFGSTSGLLLLGTWSLACVGGVVGLFMFRPWARTLTLWLTVVSLALYPLLGSTVHSWLSSALVESGAMAWGAMLAIAYSEPIKSYFQRKPREA